MIISFWKIFLQIMKPLNKLLTKQLLFAIHFNPFQYDSNLQTSFLFAYVLPMSVLQLTPVDNVTLSLLSQLDHAAFSLDSGNYLITNQRFNYEQKNKFSIKIRATDNGQPVLYSDQILDIMVCTMYSYHICSWLVLLLCFISTSS